MRLSPHPIYASHLALFKPGEPALLDVYRREHDEWLIGCMKSKTVKEREEAHVKRQLKAKTKSRPSFSGGMAPRVNKNKR